MDKAAMAAIDASIPAFIGPSQKNRPTRVTLSAF